VESESLRSASSEKLQLQRVKAVKLQNSVACILRITIYVRYAYSWWVIKISSAHFLQRGSKAISLVS
jgi:hypothetical protein